MNENCPPHKAGFGFAFNGGLEGDRTLDLTLSQAVRKAGLPPWGANHLGRYAGIRTFRAPNNEQVACWDNHACNYVGYQESAGLSLEWLLILQTFTPHLQRTKTNSIHSPQIHMLGFRL